MTVWLPELRRSWWKASSARTATRSSLRSALQFFKPALRWHGANTTDLLHVFLTVEWLILEDTSGFYAWRSEDESQRAAVDRELTPVICDLIQHFIVFEVDGANIVGKMAGYHQFHACKL